MTTSRATSKHHRQEQASPDPHVKSHDEILRDMRKYGRHLAKNPDAAREFLLEAGIITPDGNLRKVFGG